MKRSPHRWILPLAALVVAGAGFAVGRTTRDRPRSPEIGDPPVPARQPDASPLVSPLADPTRPDRVIAADRADPFDTFLAGLVVSDLEAAKSRLHEAVAELDPPALLRYLKAKRRITPTFRERLALDAMAARLGSLDPAEALEMVQSGWPPEVANALIRGAFTTLARTDPGEAARQARGLTNSAQRTAAIDGVTVHLARTDPTRGLALLKSTPMEIDAWIEVHEHFFATWFETDPAGALSFAAEAAEFDATSIVSASARHDPEATFAWLGTLKKFPRSFATQALYQYGFRDADAAMRKLESLSQASEARDFRYAEFRRESWSDARIFSQWIAQDAEAATAWALALPDSEAKSIACETMFAQLCKADGRRAVAFLETMPDELARRMIHGEGLAYHLAWALPEDAVRLGLKFGSPERGMARMTSEFYRWSAVDPDGAVAFLLQHPESASEDFADVWKTVFQEINKSDPSRAVELLDSDKLPPGVRDESKANLISSMAESDPTAAVAEARMESEPELRARLLSHALTALAKRDPQAAATEALGETDPELRQRILRETLWRWADTDPARLQTWAESLDRSPRDDLQDELALAKLATTKVPFEEAMESLRSLDGEMSDSAREALVVRAAVRARNDPLAAAEWARALPSDAMREAAVPAVVASWIAFDPAGANAWASGLDTSDTGLGASVSTAVGSHYLQVRMADKAAPWIARIPDPAKRAEMIQAAFPYGGNQSEMAQLVTGLEAAGLPQAELNAYRKLYSLPPK